MGLFTKEERTSENIPVNTGVSSGVNVTLLGALVNVVLVIFKLWAGFLSRSQALIADGVHSLSDLFSDVVVILGLKWGRKHEDENHPFGHARIETISSMIVGIILILVGLGITYNALFSIYEHEASRPGKFALYAAGFSILVKEVLFWYTHNIGKRLKSPVLIANAWHHRSDALSSVAVFIGVGATYINPAWHLADAFAAVVVTFFIVRVGINLVWSAFRELSDTAPDREVLERISRQAVEVAGVRQVHDLRARHSGSEIFVEIHVVVDPNLTVREGHDIAREVKARLITDFREVTRVIIHVDPELKE